MEENIEQLKNLREEQGRLADRLNSLVFQTIIIFGVPAIVGYFIGAYLEKMGISKIIAFVLPLMLTFALSWWVLIKKLKKLTNKVKVIEDRIRELAPQNTPENSDSVDKDLVDLE